ncbi:hypothetical protein VNI00_011410 [Paramarasmius palmivorus]|uniref:F-box domain-containing protein n=1 Tax=Paramarasmius palmivorus TaxID=297713 RepID=A0AAW0CCK5_9AGAR
MTLRPNYQALANAKRLKEESDIVIALELVVPNMQKLRKFMWDGVEMPGNRLWLALRYSCPDLKDIGTNIGTLDIDPNSELFEFSDLLAFTLTTENRNANYRRRFELNAESLPPALWYMLVKRCPDLRSLTIGHGGSTRYSLRTLDVYPLLQGTWPHLSSITLFNCDVYDPTLLPPLFPIMLSTPELLLDWMKDRPALKRIHVDFSMFTMHKLDYANEGLEAATVHPFAIVPLTPIKSCAEVSFDQVALTGRSFRLIAPHLSKLPNLKRLSIWIDFSKRPETDTNYCDAIPQLQIMMRNCKQLEDLCIRCSTRKKETFTLKEFSAVLRVPGLKLKRLELWKRKAKDDSLLVRAAARWAREFPSLDEIVLYRMGKYGEWTRQSHRITIALAGTYQVVRAFDKTALRLSAVERVWPDCWRWSSRFDYRIPPPPKQSGLHAK